MLKLNRMAVLLIASVVSIAPTLAQNGDDYNAQLEQVMAELELNRKDLAKTHSLEQTQSIMIRKLARRRALLEQRKANNDRQYLDYQHRYHQSLSKWTRLSKEIERRQKDLSGLLSTSYLLTRRGNLQALFNQSTVADADRLLTYAKYFYLESASEIKSLQQAQSRLTELASELSIAKDIQEQAAERVQQDIIDLKIQQVASERLLTNLQSNITAKQAAVRRLEEREKELRTLVQALLQEQEEDSETNRFEIDHLPDFSQLKGQLDLPLAGEIRSRFGEIDEETSMRTTGLEIAAAAGTPIRSIYDGKVVFAGEMRCCGLSIFVKHGNGYLSIYKNTGAVYYAKGARVLRDQPIAEVGSTGSGEEGMMQFHIYHGESVLDPLLWCSQS